jgi:hypothetical protein
MMLAVERGEVWPAVARLLRPETEDEAAGTDAFRRAAQADEKTWLAFLAQLQPQPDAVAA